MFFDALKEYYRVVTKNNMMVKIIHILLLIILHGAVVYFLPNYLLVGLWTLVWLVTVPPFCGWYLVSYNPDKKKDVMTK